MRATGARALERPRRERRPGRGAGLEPRVVRRATALADAAPQSGAMHRLLPMGEGTPPSPICLRSAQCVDASIAALTYTSGAFQLIATSLVE
ncbi:hypothetical protein CVO74_06910 [Xanthomonas prunicola]|uniref:Uncharacterized protein n=1 Tax=Xanthomonas prunicola TaxID=2053930 RepID=A0A2N3RHK7_9XANT|nr:hypothetical protein XpruCFBP8353_13950 [Xanthomonas prunicola]PKV16249.1 hypothetical protein XpruCFBP8354_13935 [Xanthomonas prunicola]PKV22915.1 hypothetical protein CVO74_06910 [Xanthomonas prunicola]